MCGSPTTPNPCNTEKGSKGAEAKRPLRKRNSSADWSKLEAGGGSNLLDADSDLFKLLEDSETPAPIHLTADASAFAAQDDYFPLQKKQSMRKKLLINKLTLLLFLATGTCVTLAAQAVTDLVGLVSRTGRPPFRSKGARNLLTTGVF